MAKKSPLMRYLTDGKPGHHWVVKTVAEGLITALAIGAGVFGFKYAKPHVQKFLQKR